MDSEIGTTGLREEDKCSYLFATAWAKAAASPVVVHRFAHSGADIWNDGQSGLLAAADPTPPPFPEQFAVQEGAVRRASRAESAELALSAAIP